MEAGVPRAPKIASESPRWAAMQFQFLIKKAPRVPQIAFEYDLG